MPTTFLIVLALLPKSRVDLVSASLKLAGEQQMTMVVLAFPKIKKNVSTVLFFLYLC